MVVASAWPPVDLRIGNRYRVIGIAGKGGLGAVYKAEDERLRRIVALKMLHPRFAEDARVTELFRNEGLATARLSHPGIVRIFDAGEHGEVPFLVTEFIAGKTLKQVLSIQRLVPQNAALRVIERVAEALMHAHSAGVVHLDVKPSNILLGDDNRVLLSDFGLALITGEMARDRKFIAGTAAYMSPEQSAGGTVDVRSDVYSLTVVLHEILTGVSAGNTVEAARQLTPGLGEIVARGLETDPARRFATMSEFLGHLRPFLTDIETAISPTEIFRRCAFAQSCDETGVYDSGLVSASEPVLGGYAVSIRERDQATLLAPPDLPAAKIPILPNASEPKPSPPPAPDDLNLRHPAMPAVQQAPTNRTLQEIAITTADGTRRVYPLTRDRLTLGRSSTCELSFPDDIGLSRSHLAFENSGEGWTVRDLGSKNGSLINGVRLTAPRAIRANDRIMAGHVIIECGSDTRITHPAVRFAEDEGSSVITQVGAPARIMIAGDPSPRGDLRVQALIKAGRELAAYRPLPELFRTVLQIAIDAVHARRGVLLILEEDRLEVRAAIGEGFSISTTVRDRVMAGTSLLVRDANSDLALRERVSIVAENVRSLMAAPLQSRERIIGLIYVDSPDELSPFTKDDLNLLTVMANVAAIRIEQSRLTGIEATERRLLAELDQAAEIQRGALPTHPPSSRGLDIAAFNEPSRTVGGDYYDFYQYPDGQLCAVIADVSGKGMPAALLMAMVQSRTQVLLETCQGIAELATRLNASTRNLAGNRFFTFCACVLSPDRDSIEYCNAGHNLPLILRADGKIERLDIGGPPMGILPEYEYTSAAIQFGPGDILIMFSDGLIEETQPRIQEEFGEERLIETFRRARAGSAEEIAAAIRGAVNDWTAGAPIADDQTLIVIRREAS